MGDGTRPTSEFRREAMMSGRTRREIAADLGIGLSTLTRWQRHERDAGEPSGRPASGTEAVAAMQFIFGEAVPRDGLRNTGTHSVL